MSEKTPLSRNPIVARLANDKQITARIIWATRELQLTRENLRNYPKVNTPVDEAARQGYITTFLTR